MAQSPNRINIAVDRAVASRLSEHAAALGVSRPWFLESLVERHAASLELEIRRSRTRLRVASKEESDEPGKEA